VGLLHRRRGQARFSRRRWREPTIRRSDCFDANATAETIKFSMKRLKKHGLLNADFRRRFEENLKDALRRVLRSEPNDACRAMDIHP